MPRQKEQFGAMRSTTKQKIIAAGLQLFAYQGLAATSIQDIASLAGVSVGLMYHYYRSKEDLFTELAETIVQAADDSMRMIFDSDLSPADEIKTLSKDVIDSIAAGDELSQYCLFMIHFILAGELKQKVAEVRGKANAPLQSAKQTIGKGQEIGHVKPGDPNELTVMYSSAIQGLAIAKLTMGDRFILPGPHVLNGLLLRTDKNAD